MVMVLLISMFVLIVAMVSFRHIRNVQIIDLPSCPTSIDIESDVVQFCFGGNLP